MSTLKEPPVLAAELPDYRYDPAEYELEETSRPDEMAMLDQARDTALGHLKGCQDAWVLDLCCGTGLSLRGIPGHKNVGKIVGVDICKNFIKFIRKQYGATKPKPTFILGDAINTELPAGKWDLIMMASCYHHIEDERKVQLLRKVRDLLKPSGEAIIAENILPDYEEGNENSYCASVRHFYDRVLETARRENPSLPDHVAGLIERVAQYGFDGEYEYKVKMEIFKRHIEEAGLKILDAQHVWPWPGEPSLKGRGGNFVFRVNKVS